MVILECYLGDAFLSDVPVVLFHLFQWRVYILYCCFVLLSLLCTWNATDFFFYHKREQDQKKKKVVLNWWKDEIYLRLYLCSYRQISYYMIKDSQMVLKNVLEFQCKGCAEMISGQNFKLRKEVDRAKLLICSPLSRRPDWKVSLSLVCHCDQVHGFVVLSVNW